VEKTTRHVKTALIWAGGLQPRKNDSAEASIALARTGCSVKHSSVKPQTRDDASTTAVFHGLKLFIQVRFHRTGSRAVWVFSSWQHRSVFASAARPKLPVNALDAEVTLWCG
jgi:hypothetical protein